MTPRNLQTNLTVVAVMGMFLIAGIIVYAIQNGACMRFAWNSEQGFLAEANPVCR
jgi:hypothetical protein